MTALCFHKLTMQWQHWFGFTDITVHQKHYEQHFTISTVRGNGINQWRLESCSRRLKHTGLFILGVNKNYKSRHGDRGLRAEHALRQVNTALHSTAYCNISYSQDWTVNFDEKRGREMTWQRAEKWRWKTEKLETLEWPREHVKVQKWAKVGRGW